MEEYRRKKLKEEEEYCTSFPIIDNPASDITFEYTNPLEVEEAFTTWVNSWGGATLSKGSWREYNITETIDSCGNTFTRRVNFVAQSYCGNPMATSASFIVVDTTPPIITEGPIDATYDDITILL